MLLSTIKAWPYSCDFVCACCIVATTRKPAEWMQDRGKSFPVLNGKSTSTGAKLG